MAEKQGLAARDLRGAIQNDILKEYVARGTYIFPPEPSMRLITDTFAFCTARVPERNTISISGYHIREAGSDAAQEVAFTLADAIAYVEAAVRAGLTADRFAARGRVEPARPQLREPKALYTPGAQRYDGRQALP